MGLLRSPTGQIVDVPDDQSDMLRAGGYEPVDAGTAGVASDAMARPDTGVIGAVGAGLSSTLSGATLGLSDYALKGMLDRGQFEQMKADREQHNVLSGAGQIAGMILPSIIAPGSGVAGLASEANAAARGLGGARGVAASLGVSGLEGSLYNAGAYLSDTALGDRELSAEGLAGALGSGFEFGVGGGAAALGIEQGSIAARRMFSRLTDGGKKAYEAAEQAWTAKYQSTLEANDAAADIAKAKLAEARLARTQAQVAQQNATANVAAAKAAAPGMDTEWARQGQLAELGAIPPTHRAAGLIADAGKASLAGADAGTMSEIERQLRELADRDPATAQAIAGMPHPEAMGMGAFAAPALSPAAERELAAAVAEHEAARVELDDVLRRIEAPEVGQPGGTLGQRAVPVGEFGAPGARGYNPGEVAAPGPPSQAPFAGAAEGTPVTRALRKGTSSGEATTAFDFKDSGLTFDPETKSYFKGEGAAVSAPPPIARELGSEKEFRDFQAALRLRLDDNEIEQAVRYSREYYNDVNRHLRGTGTTALPESEAKIIPALDSMLEKSRIDEPIVTHRGASLKRVGNLQPGDVYVDPGYGSTSWRSNNVKTFGDAHMIIESPAGTRIAPIPSSKAEGEFLLPRDTRYRITGRRELPGGRVELRAIVEDFAPSAAAERLKVGPPTINKPLEAMSKRELEYSLDRAAEHQHSFQSSAERKSPEFKAAQQRYNEVSERLTAVRNGAQPVEWSPPLASAPAADDLLSQLRGTSAKLGEGESLVAMGAPARAEYRTAKAEKTAATAEHFRAKATGSDLDPFFADLRRPKTRDAYVAGNIGRAMREEGSHAAALVKVEREWAGMSGGAAEVAAATPTTWREFQSSKMAEYMKSEGGHAGAMKRMGEEWRALKQGEHPLSVKQLEVAHEAAVERAATATAPAERVAAEQEAASIERQMTRVGARPGVVEDVAATAEVVTKYERASAKLTEALGDAAPPAAQDAAKAFRDAESAAEAKAMDRTTRAIDDHVEQPGVVPMRAARGQGRPLTTEEWRAKYPARAAGSPDAVSEPIDAGRAAAPTGGKPGARYVEAAQQGKLHADAGYARARAAETEAKLGADTAQLHADRFRAGAEAARPQASGAKPPGTLGTIATAIGVAGELGVPGIPHPHDIPVIGPLLGMWLKYKAIKAAAGRFVGRVPATGDARAAALVARTKDRIATAVDRTLGLASKPAARTAIVATTTLLAHRAFDDGEPDAPKGASAQELAAVRMREIAAAAARPELVVQQVRKQMRGVADPDLIAAAEQHMVARFQYLASVMPKLPPDDPFSQTKWLPSPAAANDLGQRLAAANDPEHAFDNPTPATVETLSKVHPQLLAMAKQRLMERVADMKAPMPYQDQLRGSLLFGMALMQSWQPANASILQGAHTSMRPEPIPQPTAPPAPPTPSVAQPTNLNQMYDPGNQRRAARM